MLRHAQLAVLLSLVGCGSPDESPLTSDVPLDTPQDSGVTDIEPDVSCADADLDGVCDVDDVCDGFDDLADSDGDGTADGCDLCPQDPLDDSDGDSVCDSADICPGSDDASDGDGDGIPDGCDNCEGAVTDSDGDGVPDACDLCPGADDAEDDDTDTVPDGCDVCPGFDDLADTDVDSVPDGCDICPEDVDDDSDSDGVCDSDDACPGENDADDLDADSLPDLCDPCPEGQPDASNDQDSDGICDSIDICAGGNDSNDMDGDGLPDFCDPCPHIDHVSCLTRLTCTDCAFLFKIGERVRATDEIWDNIGPGSLGTVLSGTIGAPPMLVQWDDLTTGHDGDCAQTECGVCEPSPIDNRYYVDCDQVESALVECACELKYSFGDVVTMTSTDRDNLPAGTLGTVIAGREITRDGSVLLVEWEGLTTGHTGQCESAVCGLCEEGAELNRLWVSCDEVQFP